jgi:hypothetical protein
MNPITGLAEVDICGEKYSIRFDWEALAAVTSEHGDAPNLFSPEIVASVASIGMRKHHPDMTAAKIRELSPPLVPFAHAVQQALQWAYFGAEDLPEDEVQKKSQPMGGWWRRIRLLFEKG